MKTLSLRLSEALDAKLTKLAEKQGTTKSDVVRRALEEFVQNGSVRPPLTAFDLVEDLCGSVDDAPPDLSTNPKYMEDFGK
ncbi:MAG: CopG family transcriptional regulator [Planctomycetes bacterium]|nr:CopG family transcriptional regulator [Planctomycetota bacterium]